MFGIAVHVCTCTQFVARQRSLRTIALPVVSLCVPPATFNLFHPDDGSVIFLCKSQVFNSFVCGALAERLDALHERRVALDVSLCDLKHVAGVSTRQARVAKNSAARTWALSEKSCAQF